MRILFLFYLKKNSLKVLFILFPETLSRTISHAERLISELEPQASSSLFNKLILLN